MTILSSASDSEQSKALGPSKPILELKDVSIYQDTKIIIQAFSLDIHPGEFVYLIGKTGSGKSSLLRALYGDIPILHGKASLCGFNLTRMNSSKIPYLRRKLGIIFQDFNLLQDRNVGHNLDFVLKATGHRNRKKRGLKIDEALTLVGLQHKKYDMPHTLSGGEQQRIVIARALLNDPQLIIADEPTGNLDPETSDRILEILKGISLEKNTGVLLATHDYRLIEKFSGRLLQCEKGRLSEIEKPKALKKSPSKFLNPN